MRPSVKLDLVFMPSVFEPNDPADFGVREPGVEPGVRRGVEPGRLGVLPPGVLDGV